MIRTIAPLLLAGAPRIVGGEPSPPSQDATVYLRLPDSTCSGTLVASNLVLTARHCVVNVESPSDIGVAIGIGARHVPVIAHGRKIFVPNTDAEGDDIAILALDRRIVDVPPASVRTTRPTIGERAVAVGYGEDGDGLVPELRRQRVSLRVDAIGPAVVEYEASDGTPIHVELADKMIATGESTCFGDSGGPLYDEDGSVIGVTSSGVDEQCRDRPSLFVGTHAFTDLFIRARSETIPGKDLSESTLGTGDSDPRVTHGTTVGGCSTTGAHSAAFELELDSAAPALLGGVFAWSLLRVRRRRLAFVVVLGASCRPSDNIGGPVARTNETRETSSAPLPPAKPSGACSGELSEVSCRECCLERAPLASDRYARTFSSCVCTTPGTCATGCGASYCAGKQADDACFECLSRAQNCDDLAMEACERDAECRPLLECLAESECAAASR